MAEPGGLSSSFSSVQDNEFDIIIVGGGTAGLVIAARLSEDANTRVLVIEAGADTKNDPRVYTPGLMSLLYGDKSVDWDYMTPPQPHLKGRQLGQSRGKMLGGSSAMNFCAILYPSKSDMDAWAALGNPGWDSESVLPYLRKFHTFHPPGDATKGGIDVDYIDANLQGTNGPIQVSFGSDGYSETNRAWTDTFHRLGYGVSGDPITGEALGCFTNPTSVHPTTKERSSSRTAYYNDEVAKRPNLQILTEALVEKVLLEEVEGSIVATGVRLQTKDGQHHEITAKDEVVISGGAINSPQILELSGIGERQLLESLGVSTIIDNPHVGENLQDHVFSSLSFELADGFHSADGLASPEILRVLISQLETTRDGPLGDSWLSVAYMPLMDLSGPVDTHEIKSMIDAYIDKYPSFSAKEQQYKILRESLENPKEPSAEYMLLPFQINMRPVLTLSDVITRKDTKGEFITIIVMLNHPFSRGEVHITSADPTAKANFDPRYLSHPLDVEILARQTQYIENIASTEPFASVLKRDGVRIPADRTAHDLETSKDIVRDRPISVFHPCGTCAMMPREIGGVVNERLIVHGTRNLRIADASIFPLEPVGNIQSCVYLVAEKAADLIKEDRNKE
ncbi:hypothetical protein Plec18167_008114 [Paecilomyces lecythidis]|uniref:Glucose-methanol-choline oxidoreductase N-terminal domain-containing protein n=1 Tax=Paecilomyces lecythidis TaxID=3004212 RepID=A0ABR3WYP4_9EURO